MCIIMYKAFAISQKHYNRYNKELAYIDQHLVFGPYS